MMNPGLLILSAVCFTSAVAFVLFPDPLLRLSTVLNRTLLVLDHFLMRYRYAVALLLFGVSYLLFSLALMFPGLRT